MKGASIFNPPFRFARPGSRQWLDQYKRIEWQSKWGF